MDSSGSSFITLRALLKAQSPFPSSANRLYKYFSTSVPGKASKLHTFSHVASVKPSHLTQTSKLLAVFWLPSKSQAKIDLMYPQSLGISPLIFLLDAPKFFFFSYSSFYFLLYFKTALDITAEGLYGDLPATTFLAVYFVLAIL